MQPGPGEAPVVAEKAGEVSEAVVAEAAGTTEAAEAPETAEAEKPLASPRRRARAQARAVAAADTDTDTSTGTDGKAETDSKAGAAVADPVARPRSAVDGWVLPVSLLVVALLFAGLGAFFVVKSRSVTYDAALVDSATTSAVNGQVREAVEKSFSYNFADVTATEKAAKELLTGKALCQYNAVFGPVREIAPQQKLVVSVRVVSSAVSSLRDGRATVLVFADQVTTRTTDNSSGGGTAMLQVGAVEDGGRWKIDNLRMFGATADQDRQLQSC
ncbi:hypothetical protein [Lentzea guizhouensis]|uniref:hypothetical protein n=1 Tax=Lentzea guizhouensis TaxID=1586287 RepID=UPI0012B6A308|nr:hypothetical protein [Lentzea guizhouensis]